MAIGDKIAIADKPTLDVVSANVGSNADTANATGSAHAKLKDIKTFVNGINNKVGQDEEPASPTGSVHAKLKDIKANLGGGGDVTGVDGAKYSPVVLRSPRMVYLGETPNPGRTYMNARCVISDNDYFYVVYASNSGIQKFSKKTLKLVASGASGLAFGGIAIKDDFLYVTSGTAVRKYNKNTLAFVTTSDPLPSAGSKIISDEDRLYVVCNNGSTSRVVAISTINLTIVAQTGNLGTNIPSMAVNYNYLYVGRTDTNVIVHTKSNLSNVGSVVLSGGAGSNVNAIVANNDYAFAYSNNGTTIQALVGSQNNPFSMFVSKTLNSIADMAIYNDDIIAVGSNTAHAIVRLRANDLRPTEVVLEQDALARRGYINVHVDDDFIYCSTSEGTVQIYTNGYAVTQYKKGV